MEIDYTDSAMATCSHSSALQIVKHWVIGDEETDNSSQQVSDPFSFHFCSNVKFYLKFDSWSSCSSFCLSCNDDLNSTDFVCYLWAERNAEVIGGSKNQPLPIGEEVWTYDDCEPLRICCRIVYKGQCAYCEKMSTLESNSKKKQRLQIGSKEMKQTKRKNNQSASEQNNATHE
ncbi:hypothetical protein M3Y94_00648800 [Aphelenchoides besseyi]|nr:hypothetical protein M3Y94_00648800 [Aphelenchoides besseyi]KAI6231101.1 hypothetical protein M3Y95_00345800 [Aphelenchoides besseyi]